jgi:UDP-N-acetylmuramate: L-alanyl-gamma-D-glutamyl-meso-diaminopimelate ligase
MSSLYFLGIGGTAMASVAGAFKTLGVDVIGSDASVYPPMNDYLNSQHISYAEGYHEKNVISQRPGQIVVGNAISRGNPELEYALDEKIPLISMAELVGQKLIAPHTSVVVTGTHGKTTTASLCAWLLDAAGLLPGFLIGGIAENFGRGCRPATVIAPRKSGYFVSEGDEYDTAFFDKRSKFLHYHPDVAIINNIEFDHADIFNSIEDIELSFRRFVNLVPRSGLVLVNHEDERAKVVCQKSFAPVQSFGFEASAFWRADDISLGETETTFAVLRDGKRIGQFTSPMMGGHNVRNTLAAIAMATHLGVPVEKIQAGLSLFKSAKRRLEVLVETNGIALIDDFAHHPTAIRVTLEAVRQKFPNRRIVACFEPRSNTTTRNFFQQELTDCFALAGVVAIGPVNRPERYAASERLDTAKIVRDLTTQGKAAFATAVPAPANYTEQLADFVKQNVKQGDVVIVLSNGDFGGLRQLLKNFLA